MNPAARKIKNTGAGVRPKHQGDSQIW